MNPKLLEEIERLKALEVKSGDRDKWEATQPGFRLERVIADEKARREKEEKNKK